MLNLKWGGIAAIFALLISVVLGIFSGVSGFHIFLRGLIFSVVFFGIGFGLRFVINSFFPELLFSEKETEGQENEQPGSRVNITLDSTGEYAVPELYKHSGDSQEMGNIEDLISGVFTPRKAESVKTNGNIPVDTWFDLPQDEQGIDRNKEESYNSKRGGQLDPFQDTSISKTSPVEKFSTETQKAEKQEVFQPQFSPSFGDDQGLGGLPDLDMMARAFSGVSAVGPAAPPVSSIPSFSATPASQSAPSSSFFQAEEFDYNRGRSTNSKSQPPKGDFDAKELAKGISTILKKD